MRPGVSQRIVARRGCWRGAIGRRRPVLPRAALLAQPPAEVVDPLSRALAFRARGPRNLIEVDLGEPLDRSADLIGQRPCDVLEAAAFRIRLTHGTMIARRCACRASSAPIPTSCAAIANETSRSRRSCFARNRPAALCNPHVGSFLHGAA